MKVVIYLNILIKCITKWTSTDLIKKMQEDRNKETEENLKIRFTNKLSKSQKCIKEIDKNSTNKTSMLQLS